MISIRFGESPMESFEFGGRYSWPLLIEIFKTYAGCASSVEDSESSIVNELLNRMEQQSTKPGDLVVALCQENEVRMFLRVLADIARCAPEYRVGQFAGWLYQNVKAQRLMGEALSHIMAASRRATRDNGQ